MFGSLLGDRVPPRTLRTLCPGPGDNGAGSAGQLALPVSETSHFLNSQLFLFFCIILIQFLPRFWKLYKKN